MVPFLRSYYICIDLAAIYSFVEDRGWSTHTAMQVDVNKGVDRFLTEM